MGGVFTTRPESLTSYTASAFCGNTAKNGSFPDIYCSPQDPNPCTVTGLPVNLGGGGGGGGGADDADQPGVCPVENKACPAATCACEHGQCDLAPSWNPLGKF